MAVQKEKNQPVKKGSFIQTDFAFGKINYTLMLTGIGLIIIGFMLMAGGGSDDPKVFNPEIFSFRRITLAPLVVMSGFVLNIYAIVKKAKD
ncbi:MAG: DUF3098 domain-containing protein [Bacteroidia bacterium]